MIQETDKWIKGMLKTNHKIRLVGQCHDCKEEVILDIDKTKEDYIITGGLVWKFEELDKPFFKCGKCAEQNQKLTNFQPTEVWSRVVGYLRPIKQWNAGKKAEKKQRKDYKL